GDQCLAAHDPVAELDAPSAYLYRANLDTQLVVVVRGRLISTTRLHDGHKQTGGLHGGIVDPPDPAILRTGDLEPLKVTPIISHLHLLCLGVPNADRGRDSSRNLLCACLIHASMIPVTPFDLDVKASGVPGPAHVRPNMRRPAGSL